MEKNTFVYRGKTYQVNQLPEKNTGQQSDEWLTEQMQGALDNKDYNTVKHRIINGLHLGWLKQM